MIMIGRMVILCAAVVFGYLAAKGDVRCSVSPDALDHLKGAVSTTVEYGHTVAWGHATGDPTPLHGRPDDHLIDDILNGKARP